MDASPDDGDINDSDSPVYWTPSSSPSPSMDSPFSRLPVELVCLVLHFASGVDELCEENNEQDVTKQTQQICTLKLVCSTFAALGDDLFVKFRDVLRIGGIRFEPSQKSLDVILAVSKNVKLRSLIEWLGSPDLPDFTPSWPNVSSELKGRNELPQALSSFPLLHSFNCSAYPTGKMGTRLEELTALFTEWFMIAAVALSTTPAERPSISLEEIGFDFLCRWRLEPMRLGHCMANITSIYIDIDANDFSTLTSDGGALKAMLAAATGLETLRLEYRDMFLTQGNGNADIFLSDCLVNQHWEYLIDCAMLFDVDESDLLPFLERHAKTLTSIMISGAPLGCANDTILMLDRIKSRLINLGRASVLLPYRFEADITCPCGCMPRFLSLLTERKCRYSYEWDIGNYLLGNDCIYDTILDTWVTSEVASRFNAPDG